MKLTPFAKLFITVVILGRPRVRLLALQGRGRPQVGRSATSRPRTPARPASASNDFDALKNAPRRPRARHGLRRASPAPALGGSAASSAGRSSSASTPGPATRRASCSTAAWTPTPASNYKKKYGLDVKFVLLEDPAAKLAAFRKGDIDIMWNTVDNWAREASILAEQNAEGEVDPHAGLVARRRRHRLARVDQVDRGPEGQEDRLHAVHAVALPAALPARRSRA